MDPLTTLYPLNGISLYSQAVDPKRVNFIFRQAIVRNTATDHHFGFPNVGFQTLVLNGLLSFHDLVHESLDFVSHQD